METVAVGMAESFETPCPTDRATQDARVRLGLDVDLSARRGPSTGSGCGYGVTLIRAGDTLHGWRFPAEVLRAAVPRFEGASCFVDHGGWFQQAASLGDLVGVISEVELVEIGRLAVAELGLVLGVELEHSVEAAAVTAAGCRSLSVPPRPARVLPSPPAAQP